MMLFGIHWANWVLAAGLLFLAWCLYIIVSVLVRAYIRHRNEQAEGDWGWGEYGVLMRQPDGSYRAMDNEDFEELRRTAEDAEDDWWLATFSEAFHRYGDGVLKQH